MKKIGIDARLYSQTGVGTYIRNLIYELTQVPIKDFEFYLYVLPEDKKKIDNLPSNFICKEAPFKWHSYQEQTSYLSLLLRDKLDLMHFTYFSFPILYPRAYIATVHDLTPLLFKTGKASTKNPFSYFIKHLVFRYVLQWQVKHALYLITPTRCIMEELANKYGSHIKRKIIPIYEGVDYKLTSAKENRSLLKWFNKPFFVYIGNFYQHKNTNRLIDAFLQVKTDDVLVLVGPNDYFSSIIKQSLVNRDTKKRVLIFHPEDQSDLLFFYKHAKALIHPSLSEGFGLPLIESQYFRLPIIASDIPVFKELLGTSYISFNPYDVMDMSVKIESFIKQPIQLQSSKVKLPEQYSFQHMSKQTLKIYQKALAS